MKTVAVIKLVILGALIVWVGHLLRGHDVLTGIVLISAVVLIALKFYFHFYHFRRGSGGSDGGTSPAVRPVPIPPNRPTSREVAAVRK